jgi:hypothetical protein
MSRKNSAMSQHICGLAFILCIAASPISAGPQEWALRFDGIGPVRVGMNLSQLNAALKEHFVQDKEPCFYVDTKRHPGIGFMIQHGRVTRVDVINRSISTIEGIRIGDMEARVTKAYGNKLQIEPHHYVDDGHYLTMYKSRYGIRFETEKGKVTGFYAGDKTAIQYTEGCL